MSRFDAFSDKERKVLAMGLVTVSLAITAKEDDPADDLSVSEKASFLTEVVPLMRELFPSVKIPDDLMAKLTIAALYGDGPRPQG